MRKIVVYPSTDAPTIIKGGEEKFRALSTEHIVSIGRRADKAAIMYLFEK